MNEKENARNGQSCQQELKRSPIPRSREGGWFGMIIQLYVANEIVTIVSNRNKVKLELLIAFSQ